MQNNNFARASRFFCKFLCRHCTTTTWKFIISRFVEDVNKRQRFSFSSPELRFSILEFNSRKNCQHLTNWTIWNKRDKVWSSATSLFKWRFRSCRRRCCLSSLISSDFLPQNCRCFRPARILRYVTQLQKLQKIGEIADFVDTGKFKC